MDDAVGTFARLGGDAATFVALVAPWTVLTRDEAEDLLVAAGANVAH